MSAPTEDTERKRQRRTPCGNCKTTWVHNDTVGCCSACHRAFRGLQAFERHQVGPRDERGRLTCLDPETATYPPTSKRSGERIYELADEALAADRGPLWRIVPTARQLADLAETNRKRREMREQAE